MPTELTDSVDVKTENGNIVRVALPNKEYVVISMCSLGAGCRYHGNTMVMGHSTYKEKKVAFLM